MSRKTRKLMWSVPIVAALAIVGALAIFMSAEPGSVYANPLPGAPMNLMVEAADGDAGRTTLVVSWDAATNASGYRIDISDQGAVWETMMMDTGSTATTYMDTTLTADDTRWYRVFAMNSHGIGPVSNAISGTTDMKVRPGSVMNLRAMPNEKNPRSAIDLSWDPPGDNGGEHVVGYEVQFHNGTDWGNLTDADATTPVTFTANNVTAVAVDDPKMPMTMEVTDGDALDPGDSRLYRVRAINGPDAFSDGDNVAANTAENTASKDWVRVTGMTAAAMPPGQVTGLTAVNTGAAEISLYWYAPEDTGGWDISGYLIQARRDGKRFQAIPKDDDLTTTPSTNVTLGDATNDHLDNMNRVIAVPVDGVVQATFGSIAAIDTTDDDTDNATQQRWYFQVFALTTDDGPDDDAATAADNVIRRSQSPSNVASDVAADRAIDHDNDTNTDAVDPLAAPTITPTGTGGRDPKKQQIDLGLALAGAITTNNDNADDRPDIVQIAYRIDYSEDEGGTWMLLERDTRFTGFGADKPYEDDKDLAFDETRHYRVFAIGRHPYTDVGPPSALSNGVTEASTAPKKPTGVMASASSLTSIMASWTAPENNGGQDIVKYIYQYAPDDGDEVAEAADFDSSVNDNADAADIIAANTDDAMTMGTFKVAALTGDTVYAFRVAAVNKNPASTPPNADRPADAAAVAAADWSDPVLFNTAEAAKPNAVEGLTSELATDASGNNRGVNLLWNKPSDKISITDYDVEVQDEYGDWVNPTGGENLSPNRTSYTDSEEWEMGDPTRAYRVRAENGVGEGPWTMVYYPREPAMHSHVAPMGEIMDQTVTVGMETTVNAAMYFSDNTGAMYEAESDDMTVASVMTNADTGMVTITGESVGTAMITVTATSGAVEAEQEFMVTVVAAALGKPMNVMVDVDDSSPTQTNVTVTWEDGANADVHHVFMIDVVNFPTAIPARIPGAPSAMTHTFLDVPSGAYVVAVQSTLGEDYEYDLARQDDGRVMIVVIEE